MTAILRSSADPANMGLDVMDGLEDWKSHVFVLEVMMKIAPEIKAAERGRARKLAGASKGMLGSSTCCKALAAAFLKLVMVFGLVSEIGVGELLEAISKFAQKKKKQAIEFTRELNLEEKAPGKNLSGEIFVVVCIDFSFTFMFCFACLWMIEWFNESRINGLFQMRLHFFFFFSLVYTAI